MSEETIRTMFASVVVFLVTFIISLCVYFESVNEDNKICVRNTFIKQQVHKELLEACLK